MVVIDAAKHKLDYKRSEIENDIPTLRKRWQGYTDPETGKEKGGASTLLSRRKQTVDVPERQGSGRIDRETGEVVYKESGRTYIDLRLGKQVQPRRRSSCWRKPRMFAPCPLAPFRKMPMPTMPIV